MKKQSKKNEAIESDGSTYTVVLINLDSLLENCIVG
jgi:hypothetical protein